MPADLTKEDLDELDRLFEYGNEHEAHPIDAPTLRALLRLARAQIEGREAGGELATELSEAKESYARWQNDAPDNGPSGAARCLHLFNCVDRVADALASMRAENEQIRADRLDDLKRLLDAVGLFSAARAESPQDLFNLCLSEIGRLRDQNKWVGNLCDKITKSIDDKPNEINRLRAERDEAVEALRPFASVNSSDIAIRNARAVYRKLATTGEQKDA